MIIGVVKESFPGERRVALIPAHIPGLTKAGLEVLTEPGAGLEAGFSDAAYQEKGGRVARDRAEVFTKADVLLQVNGPGANPKAGKSDLEKMKTAQVVIGFLDPLSAPQSAAELAKKGLTGFSMELVPRITRAQVMDALSSMATIAGYKAVLTAAHTLPRMFPMLMTAAGTVAPARVFVMGVGVAGLQAIATAHRLGAIVHAYDIRPAVKDQVISVGAKFVELPLEAGEAETKGGYAREMNEAFYKKQRELMTRVVAESDIVITTAAIPGKKAPILITADMVKGMNPGSVIIDLAAERGGNCELTEAGKTITRHGVTIIGPVNIPTTIPYHASQMYSKNITNLLLHLVKDGKFELNMEDEITRETLVTRGGEVVHSQIREILGLPVPDQPKGKDA